MSIYDKASLVLIPSGTKTSKVYSQKPVNGDGDFTFSRSTAATRVNADGNIEKETQNLLLHSNTFSNAVWVNNAGSCTRTSGQSGYDGSNDAWLLTQDSAGYDNIVQSVSSSGVNTYSIYVKGTSTAFTLRITNTGDRVLFNLSTGSVASTFGSNLIDYGMTDVGGGWYRCYLTANATITDLNIYPYFNSTTATSVTIQDAQLEQGLVARDYIETTTTAVEGGITDNVPRLDYTDSSCPALLLEPQRTNAMTYSEGLNVGLGVNYKSADVTLTPNDAESPEGYNNATKFNGVNGIADTYVGYTASTTNTFSAFLKAGTCEIAKMKHTATGAVAEITINLTSGTITNTTGAQYLDSSIVDYGNGWYRASITFTSGTTAYITRVQLGEAGYIHMYGWQIERGASYATSYIPTYGSAVTRNADRSYIENESSIIGQSEGSMYAEFVATAAGTTSQIFEIADLNTNRVFAQYESDNDLRISIRANNVAVVDYTESGDIIEDGETYKLLLRYSSNGYAFFLNGSKLTSGTNAVNFSDTIDSFYLNETFSVSNRQTNDFKQVMLFPTALTDQEAIDLTTL